MIPSLLSPEPLLLADANQSALAAMAIDALHAGRIRDALALADRCCRAFSPAAEHLSLRAAVRSRLGDVNGSYDDLQAAEQLQPPDKHGRFLQMKMAAQLGKGDECRAHAERLLVSPGAEDYADRSVHVLAPLFPAGLGWCRLVGDNVIVQFHWNGAPSLPVTLAWDGQVHTREIAAQARGAAGFMHRAVLEVPWRAGASHFSADTSLLLFGRQIARPAFTAQDDGFEIINGALLSRLPQDAALQITVVIPVYRDLEATVACVESVIQHTAGRATVIVVDDATPEPELASYVRGLAENGRLTCIRRRKNGGFIAAVESALNQISTGDVVLLNSDTVVSAGWLDTLAKVAHSDDLIGTVTPLSNNGELTSFPNPFIANPLPSDTTLGVLNQVAQSINGDEAIDIPNGIGFCLYIKRHYLDSAGRFGAPFLVNGYFEDVEFSLRLAEQGFRNVCATGAIVAHRGSASYLQSKRSFVLQNMEEIVRRYPDLSPRTDWFIAHDPLKPSRERILKALPDTLLNVRTAFFLSWTAPTPIDHLLDTFCGDDEGGRIIVRTNPARPHELSLTISGAFGFSLSLDWGKEEDKDFVRRVLRQAGLARGFCLLFSTPSPVLSNLVGQLQFPCDIAILDETALPARWLSEPRSSYAAMTTKSSPVLDGARRIYVGCTAALPHLRQTAWERSLAPAPLMTLDRMQSHSRSTAGHAPLAVLVLDGGTAAWRDVEALGLELRRRGDDRRLIVMGTIVNEGPLLRIGNIQCLGAVSPDELANLVMLYGCAAAVIAGRSCRFYDERLPHVAALPLPVAVRNGGILGELASGAVDLPISQDASPRQMAASVMSWSHAIACGSDDSSAFEGKGA